MSKLVAYIDGVGALGPGFNNWPGAVAILTGATPYQRQPTVFPSPVTLPAAERRRAGRAVRLTLAVGLEAVAHAGVKPGELASVFTSSGGDGDTCHEICQVLGTGDRQLSPTRFHNSVHNATAGYWSIATGATTPSTVLSAFDASFAAGLLEALTQVVVNDVQVLLLAYDTAYPEPLHAKRPIPDAFGVALVLAPRRSARTLAELRAELSDGPTGRMSDSQLESLRASIPAGRCLPLLRCLASGETACIAVDYLDPTHLAIEVIPCC